MTNFIVRSYIKKDEKQVIQLWKMSNLIIPKNNPLRDIDEKIRFQPDLFLVGLLDKKLIGTIMVGYEGHRGWINYLAIHQEFRGKGFGVKLMDYATEILTNMGCQKINVQIRKTNNSVIEFYKKLGFTDDEVISYGKRIEEIDNVSK
ncbi:GNAT family acetyltransferase [Thermoplasmatales archaeon ex4572_165]|nr:MAG: GNAT family acetyltransferase [Thermoplasmatales archaeon ex4572_165]RLF58751.1 MAG: GNAT family acetyltransferase [Thermoplasmata archaeon]